MVSGTNQVFNAVAFPNGVYRCVGEERMVWPLTRAVIIGTLPGVLMGAWVRIAYLADPRNFKFFAGLVLLCIEVRLAHEVLMGEGGAAPVKKGLDPAARTQRCVTDSKTGFTHMSKVSAGFWRHSDEPRRPEVTTIREIQHAGANPG